jgi:hypothetical protein
VFSKRSAQHVRDTDYLVVQLNDLSVHLTAPRKREKLISQL